MAKRLETEITVVGGGIAGLLATKKLSELGYDVMLVDKASTLGSGPSTKNEGWLHRGTVHAGVITDKKRALNVAKKLIYGYEQIMSFAPEAVEDLTSDTFALFKNEELAASTQTRWDEIDIWYQSVQLSTFFRENPEINPQMVRAAYKTKDKSLNFRILYQKLLSISEKMGANVVLNSYVKPERDGKAILIESNGESSELYSELFIFTIGLAAREIFQQLDSDLSARFWKSHSVLLPQLTQNGYFFVDPLEASIMPHGSFSVACQSEDDFQVDEPNFDVVPAMAHQVFEALVRLIPAAKKYENTYKSNACVKPDIIHGSNSPRSVDIEIHEPIPSYIVAFPGKVTESPYMVDTLIKRIFDKKFDSRIALRPGDKMASDYEK
jgi:glycerol-3-phosphate dehydrogenase